MKSLQIELHTHIAQICYFDPQSAGINVQSPQSATTPRRLTLNGTVILHLGGLQTRKLGQSESFIFDELIQKYLVGCKNSIDNQYWF